MAKKKAKTKKRKKPTKPELEKLVLKMTGKISALENQNRRSAIERQTLHQEKRNLEKTVIGHGRTIKYEQEKNAGLKTTNNQLKSSETSLNATNKGLTEEIGKLGRELSAIEKQLVQNNDQKIHLKKAVEALNKAIY